MNSNVWPACDQKRRAWRKVAAAFIYLCSQAAVAAPFVGGGADLTQFCDQSSPRSTIVYLDTRAVAKLEDLQWAKDLINQLKTNMAPHEPISLVALNSANVSVEEIASFCFPDLWPQEPREAQGWFSQSTENQLEDGKQAFDQQVAIALQRAIEKGKEIDGSARVEVIRALASDTSRYARNDETVRLLVYSDFAERSDLIDTTEHADSKEAEEIQNRLGIDFHRAILYAINTNEKGSPAARDEVNQFFKTLFQQSNAFPSTVSGNLSLPASPPGPVYGKADVQGEWNGQSFQGVARLIADADGKIQDSYVVFFDQGSALLEGRFTCDDESCRINSKTLSSTVTNEAGETFRLEGPLNSLSGILGWPNYQTEEGDAAVIELYGEITIHEAGT